MRGGIVPGLIAVAIILTACGTGTAARTTAKAQPTKSGGMSGGHMGKGKPNMNLPTKQVAPAVTAMLMPAGPRGCNHHAGGSGMVKLIPVHVGKMSGPHVTVIINAHGLPHSHQYGLSGSFVGKGPARWSGMAEVDRTNMMGQLMVKTRLMPMLRAGRYTAQILLHDTSCGMAMRHPLAYETPKTMITLR